MNRQHVNSQTTRPDTPVGEFDKKPQGHRRSAISRSLPAVPDELQPDAERAFVFPRVDRARWDEINSRPTAVPGGTGPTSTDGVSRLLRKADRPSQRGPSRRERMLALMRKIDRVNGAAEVALFDRSGVQTASFYAQDGALSLRSLQCAASRGDTMARAAQRFLVWLDERADGNATVDGLVRARANAALRRTIKRAIIERAGGRVVVQPTDRVRGPFVSTLEVWQARESAVESRAGLRVVAEDLRALWTDAWLLRTDSTDATGLIWTNSPHRKNVRSADVAARVSQRVVDHLVERRLAVPTVVPIERSGGAWIVAVDLNEVLILETDVDRLGDLHARTARAIA